MDMFGSYVNDRQTNLLKNLLTEGIHFLNIIIVVLINNTYNIDTLDSAFCQASKCLKVIGTLIMLQIQIKVKRPFQHFFICYKTAI